VDTDLTCAEIAARCGFQDPGYFSRMFHRTAGLQPLAYREQARFRPD
jgi:transcriptional regulator GlxA family with amidase domain